MDAGPVDRRYAAAVVDLALRAAEVGVASGAVTSEATAYALTICDAYGVPADVDITWTSVTISYHRRGRAEPITGFRRVGRWVTDYTLLTRLLRLIDEVGAGQLSLEAARDRMDAIQATRLPYRGWVVCLGQMAVGVGVAGLLGGRPLELTLAGVAIALLYVVQSLLGRTRLSGFFVQAFGAAVPTTMALAIMHVRAGGSSVFALVSPSMIVAAGIVWMLAGVGIVGAARDAMDGNLITATARAFDALLQTAGIVVGVIVTLWLGFRLGVEGYIAPTAGHASPSPTQVFWASVVAIGTGLAFQLGLRDLPYVAVLGGIGFGVYQYSLPWIGSGPGAVALGAIVVGFLAQIVTGRWRIPLIALVTSAVVALMPGSALYRGLYEAINSFDEPLSVQAQINLGEATMIGLALAAGSTLGSQLARPLGRR